MNVTTYFKQQGEGVNLLILHSTKDDLAKRTVDLLKANLANEVAVHEYGIATLSEITSISRTEHQANVVMLIAHGDEEENKVWLFGDVDQNGEDLGTNPGLLTAALDGLLDNCLCLFGICHFGQDLLRKAIIGQGGALACVAPKPDSTITVSDIGTGFAGLLNELQSNAHSPVGINELQGLLQNSLSDQLFQKLACYDTSR